MGILEKKMETTIMGNILGFYSGYIGIMENRMESTTMGIIFRLYWGYMGIMEKRKRMETTVMGYLGLGLKLFVLIRFRV